MFPRMKMEEYIDSKLCSIFQVKPVAKNITMGATPLGAISCTGCLFVYLIKFCTSGIIFYALREEPEFCNFIIKETLAQVFPCEFCEISKNTFFTEHIWATAPDIIWCLIWCISQTN